MIEADIRARYGHDVPARSVPADVLRDFKLHLKYHSLKRFVVMHDRETDTSHQRMLQRAKITWEKISELIKHLEAQKRSE